MNRRPLDLEKILARITHGRGEGIPAFALVFNSTQRHLRSCHVQVADTSRRRRQGLIGRIGLDLGEGLWIVPCEAVHTFGMSFPIDLVYLDRAHRVVKTCDHVGPKRFSACLRAHSVLELAAGAINDMHLQRGDILTIVFIDQP